MKKFYFVHKDVAMFRALFHLINIPHTTIGEKESENLLLIEMDTSNEKTLIEYFKNNGGKLKIKKDKENNRVRRLELD